MGGMIAKQISKNYRFPKQFQSKSEPYKGLCLVEKANPKNNILPQYRCSTFTLATNQQVQPAIYSSELCKQLKIVTYNIWFQTNNAKSRYLNLLQLLEDSNADFICLQEVTQQFLNLMRKSVGFKDYYIGQYQMHWYDTVIISKFRCVNYKIPFDKTFMSRALLISELVTGQQQSILIASVHYESLENTQIRIAQLKESFYLLSWSEKCLLVGDFNFADKWKENQAIPKDYCDLWLLINKQQTPTMQKTPKYSAWRPDHMLAKGADLESSLIYMIGDFTVSPYEHESMKQIEIDGVVRTPSDHMGLIARVVFKK